MKGSPIADDLFCRVSPQGRRSLERAFLAVLRAREPRMVWTLAPDEAQPVLDGRALARAGSGGDDNSIKDGGK